VKVNRISLQKKTYIVPITRSFPLTKLTKFLNFSEISESPKVKYLNRSTNGLRAQKITSFFEFQLRRLQPIVAKISIPDFRCKHRTPSPQYLKYEGGLCLVGVIKEGARRKVNWWREMG
jgi:hypothetical protein